MATLCLGGVGKNQGGKGPEYKSGVENKINQPTSLATPDKISPTAARQENTNCAGAYDAEKSCDALSANAAHEQAIYALIQTIVGALTLIAAAAAAIYAAVAAHHTKRSADIADSALNDSRDASLEESDRFIKQLSLTKKSVEASIALEVPYLRGFLDDLMNLNAPVPQVGAYGGVITHGAPQKYSTPGSIIIRNFGRTNAYPIRLGVGWSICKKLPAQPKYFLTKYAKTDAVIRPISEDSESCFSPDLRFTIECSEDDQKLISTGDMFLWVFAYLRYKDFTDAIREDRFCWRYVNRSTHDMQPFYFFDRDGNPPKAYTNKLKISE